MITWMSKLILYQVKSSSFLYCKLNIEKLVTDAVFDFNSDQGWFMQRQKKIYYKDNQEPNKN